MERDRRYSTLPKKSLRSRGATRIGLAVELTNLDARRLYERRGYHDWGHGEVIDDWDEIANDGTVLARHHEVCSYLLLQIAT